MRNRIVRLIAKERFTFDEIIDEEYLEIKVQSWIDNGLINKTQKDETLKFLKEYPRNIRV